MIESPPTLAVKKQAQSLSISMRLLYIFKDRTGGFRHKSFVWSCLLERLSCGYLATEEKRKNTEKYFSTFLLRSYISPSHFSSQEEHFGLQICKKYSLNKKERLSPEIFQLRNLLLEYFINVSYI